MCSHEKDYIFKHSWIEIETIVDYKGSSIFLTHLGQSSKSWEGEVYGEHDSTRFSLSEIQGSSIQHILFIYRLMKDKKMTDWIIQEPEMCIKNV